MMLKKCYAIVFALAFSSGCAITVDHMEARAFTRGGRDAARRANDQTANAALLLLKGKSPEEVETTLRESGIPADQAHHVVEIAQAIVSKEVR